MARNKPMEQPIVRMAVPGGNAQGSGAEGIPRGIEVMVKKASVDPAFRASLIDKRSAAAVEIGLELTPPEAAMLEAAPVAQLEGIIAGTIVAPMNRAAFLGKAAAAMLLALGAVAGCGVPPTTKGIRPDPPDRKKKGEQPEQAKPADPTPQRPAGIAGIVVREPKPPDNAKEK